MESKIVKTVESPAAWKTPTLVLQGTVDEILKQGGGKESLLLADSGEMRCEKPHVSKCTPV